MRPKPPPLIIQRAANSPLADSPVKLDENGSASTAAAGKPNDRAISQASDDTVYICGARTKKGTPCHRRVHAAGDRCFQHKGMPAMVPQEKLVIKSNDHPK